MRVEREREREKREINPSVKFDGGLLIHLSLCADLDSVDHRISIGPRDCCWATLILEVRFLPPEKLGILRL